MIKYIVIIPFIIQLFFSLTYPDKYPTSLIYNSLFIISFLIFSCVFSKYYIVVSAKDEKISINKLIQFLVILLFAFKASILISKIINGLDYSAVRDYYFRGEDRVEDLYLNSKILLYIYNYLYIPLFIYALISSIEKRKGVFFWCLLFIADGIITAGRFNLYIVCLLMVFIRGINLKVILSSAVIILLIAYSVHLFRNNSSGFINSLYSIYQYHVVPVLIFENASFFVIPGHIIPFDILLSGYAIFLKFIPVNLSIFDNWYFIQDYLDEMRVYFPNQEGPFNAFGNISLFMYWEFFYFGAIFQGIIFSLLLSLKKSSHASNILIIYIFTSLYLSSFQAGRLLSGGFFIFVIIYFLIHKPKFKLKTKN